MTLKIKKDEAWKEASSLKVKINGEWKDVSTLYSKKDGAWVTVYSSGALIEFNDYPFPIPVASGWQYKATTINVNMTNLITDPSVENGGWSDATVDTSQALFGSKSLKLPSGTTSVPSISVETPIVGHIYYGRRYCKSDGDNQPADKRFEVYGGDGTGLNWVIAYNSGNYPNWTMQSKRWTVSAVNATSYVVRSFHVNGTANFWQDGFMLIDLTACFGAGNEPTQAWCDANIPFFEGTQQLSVTITDDTWTKITSDGEINISGTFTGFIKANTITLNDYCTEHIEAQDGARMDGQPSSIYPSIAFTLNNKGYLCGLEGTNVYDTSGNRTIGNPMITPRYTSTVFVNGEKGYICGGDSSSSSERDPSKAVDIYDTSGNVTTGPNLSAYRTYDPTSFVNGSKGYVCGGNWDNCTAVDVFDISGNLTTGTPLSTSQGRGTSFVNNSKGYVCGGERSFGEASSVVDVYDSSGNRTTGQSLSTELMWVSSFVNGNKGYVCAGGKFSIPKDNVNVYDSSGNMTVGQALSVRRYHATVFVLNSKGYVCGGSMNPGAQSVVDVYDSSGNRTTGTSLSSERIDPVSFVNGSKGYVCGGWYVDDNDRSINLLTVDVYYDQPEVLYTKLPITAGSTYTINGTTATAGSSQILSINSKVTGTINYAKGAIPSS